MLLANLSILEFVILVLLILIIAAALLIAVAFLIFLVTRRRSQAARQAAATPVQTLTPEALSIQLSELKKQVDAETKGFTGWVKWLSLLLAFLLAILAVPKAWIDLSQSVFTQPETKVIPESNLAISRDPKANSIQFAFGFTIMNDGKKKDSIQKLSARLIRIDEATSNALLDLSDNSFQFIEKNAKIPNRFSVTESSPREITCYVSSYLSEATRASFLVPQSRWRLSIELTGDDEKKHPIDYCFDVTDVDISDVFASADPAPMKILNPTCEGK
jgi:imidazoleglycerol phosphate dehydratase HisB